MTIGSDTHWRLFGSLVAPHRRLVAAYGVALAVATSLPLLAALLLSRFIDLAVAHAATGRLFRVAAGYVGLGLLSAIVSVLVVWRSTALAWAITDTLRRELAEFVFDADLAFHRDHTRGELVSRTDDDVTAMAQFLSRFVANTLSVGAIAIGAVAVLIVMHPRLGLTLGLCLAVVFVIGWKQRNAALPDALLDRDARGVLSGFIEERVNGADEIAALGAGAHSMARFAALAQDVVVAKQRMTLRGMTFNGQVRVALGATEATMLVVGGLAYSSGRLTLGAVFLGVRFATATRSPIESLMWRLNEVQGATGSATRVLSLLAQRPHHPGRIANPDTTTTDLVLEDVSLVYDESEGAVLDAIDLTVPAGRSLGLVGRSGSGKTSLGRLVLRLIPPSDGRVLVGGQDLQSLTEDALRRVVTGVPQEVQLFPGTVRENVTMFADGVPDEKVRKALESVGLGPWIDSQDDGLDAVLLGRTGGTTGMSAGEAQLLALARSFVRNPSIVLLDEATSRIDPVTQLLVKRAVAELLRGRTSIVIAHRLDTLDVCDDIAVLEAGRIVEHGPRLQLAADPTSRFARLLRTGAMVSEDASLDEALDAMEEVAR